MTMIARVLLAVIGVTAVFSANAGDVYKCKGADGVPIFQNTPCSTPSAQLRHDRYQVREPNTKESAASSQRAVDALLKRHPDIAYGSNQQLLKTAIAELSRPGMSSWYILDLAYTRAHNAPDWAHQPIGQQPGTAYAGTGLLQDTTRDPSCGIGSSAYQCGKVHGFRCTKSNGEVYFAASCGTSRVKVGETITTTYDAFDPQTGRLIKGGLDQGHTPVYDTMTGAMLQPNDVSMAAQPNHASRLPTRG
ncbi:MAG TPA: DUF4124 domain-containing protein [Rhodanobacteraceae bacterium]|nr:DUF4124 domain-containing protein [Rhodanobacteraceae bacterium]